MISLLTSAHFPPSLPPRFQQWALHRDRLLSTDRRWTLLRFMLAATATSSAVGKTASRAWHKDVSEPMMNGRQIEAASLLLTSAESETQLRIHPTLPPWVCFVFIKITTQHMGWGAKPVLTVYTDWGVANLCCFTYENESVVRCEMKFISSHGRWNDSSSCVWSDKIKPNEENYICMYKLTQKEFHDGWMSSRVFSQTQLFHWMCLMHHCVLSMYMTCTSLSVRAGRCSTCYILEVIMSAERLWALMELFSLTYWTEGGLGYSGPGSHVKAIIALSTVTVDINLLPLGFGRDVTWKNAMTKHCNHSASYKTFHLHTPGRLD